MESGEKLFLDAILLHLGRNLHDLKSKWINSSMNEHTETFTFYHRVLSRSYFVLIHQKTMFIFQIFTKYENTTTTLLAS